MGRNLWLYQQVESVLKGLLTASSFAAPRDNLQGAFDRHAAQVARQSMGQLVGKAAASVFAREAVPSAERQDDWLTFSVRWDAGADFADDLHQQLTVLVTERNQLAHHAMERWNIGCPERMGLGLEELDAQRERIVSVHQTLAGIVTHMHEAALALADFMHTSEFADELRRHQLDACLQDAVARAARADGWTPLSQAGQLFVEHRSRLSAEHQRALPGLSRLLIDSGLFELRDEPTKGSGSRALCRLRR